MAKSLLLLTTLLFATIVVGQVKTFQGAFDSIDFSLSKKDYESALSKIDSLLDALDPQQDELPFLKATNKLIEVQIELGTYTEAVKAGDELLANHRNVLRIDKKEAIRFYALLGDAYKNTQSNVEKALVYLNQAHTAYIRLAQSDPELEIYILGTIGGCHYYLSQYEKAISFFEKSLELAGKTTDQIQVAANLRSLGNSYWGLEDYENAARNYDRSLAILYKTQPIDSSSIGSVLHAKGYIHMNQERYETACQVFIEASQILSRKNPKVSSPVAWVYGDVGRSYLYLKEYDSALFWIQKALNANVFEYHHEDIYQNSPLTGINDDFQHFMLLKLKGQSFSGRYIASDNEKDLEGMITSFLLADEQVDEIRKSIPKPEDQATISYYSNELYSNAIDALTEVFQVNPLPKFTELAHYFIEKKKITQVHLKFLEESAKASNLLPHDILRQDQEILDHISSLKTKGRSLMMNNGDSIAQVKQELFEAQETYERFINQVKAKYPSYHASRFDLSVISPERLQQVLSENHPERALITYYNFENKLRTSFVTKDTLVVMVQTHEMDLSELAETLRSELIDPEKSEIASDSLVTLLLGNFTELLKGIKQITFIQDPALQLIPMEVLNYHDAYLFEHFDISYHFSATLFASKTASSQTYHYAGFAPSFDPADLQSLPGAELEVRAIRKVFDGTTHVGSGATEKSFKNLSQSGLIHLATHAIVDEHSPESSYLQFSMDDTQEDGKLHFFEIYNLELQAQLVTLSACNGGYGKVQNGEGVMSLSRAFAYAGVPSTAVSLWPASDKSTPKLMGYFYQNLKEGQNKSLALNNARKQYLKQARGKARDPYYWGGFVLIGDISPLEQNSGKGHWWILLAFIAIATLLFMRGKLSRKSDI